MPRNADQGEEDRINKLALSQLRSLEMIFLAFTVLSPLIGALLLRWAASAVTGRDVISWFSTGLFVLATGIRPWKHLIGRLQQHTDDLHEAIHYPQADNDVEEMRDQLQQMKEHVERLEEILVHVQGRAAVAKEEMYDYVDEAVDEIEKAIKKHEKKCDAMGSAQEMQLAGVIQSVDSLKKGTDVLLKSNGYFSSSTRRSNTVDWALSFFEGSGTMSNSHPSSPPIRPKSPSVSKHARFPSSPRLETIPEDSDFRFHGQSLSRRASMSSSSTVTKPPPLLRIPGFGLVLRIGDLATLPLRTVIQYLLSRRVYSTPSP
jgi:ribosome-associated translation inhibitor RaiA